MPRKSSPKQPAYRLKEITDEGMNALQKSLRDAIYAGPRGKRQSLTGPFQIWLNAPELGLLAQAVGAHVRYKTTLSPRLSETVILVTAQLWKAQYEWYAHEPQALKGEIAGPMSRRPSTRTAMAKAKLPKTRPITMPWYSGRGSEIIGYFGEAIQS